MAINGNRAERRSAQTRRPTPTPRSIRISAPRLRLSGPRLYYLLSVLLAVVVIVSMLLALFLPVVTIQTPGP